MRLGLPEEELDGVPIEAMAACDETERSRAQGYLLLSRLLAKVPDQPLLERLSGLNSDSTEWGDALASLAAAASGTTVTEADREFHRLFIGFQRGELVPYASYYVTGFLHDRPLVAVRRDMVTLGIARRADVHEPEDHIAALLEMMAGLIEGRFGRSGGAVPAPVSRQRQFFEAHLLGWAPLFFRDLETAGAANFYRPVGALGLLLLDIERQAFGLE